MSILKGILHHWNKTSSAYDTIHPETEVAQVTDWNNGIGATLASTALGGLVSTLTSDSLFATLLKKAMTALGVKYLAATNGYVCLGDIFGGIIIQWELYWLPAFSSGEGQHVQIPLPIAYSSAHLFCVGGIWGDNPDTKIYNFAWKAYSLSHAQATFSSGISGNNYPFIILSIGC